MELQILHQFLERFVDPPVSPQGLASAKSEDSLSPAHSYRNLKGLMVVRVETS